MRKSMGTICMLAVTLAIIAAVVVVTVVVCQEVDRLETKAEELVAPQLQQTTAEIKQEVLLASQQSVESAVQEMMGKLNLTPESLQQMLTQAAKEAVREAMGDFTLNQDTLQQLLRQMLLEGLQP